ncbi:MAG: hypothetical protein ACYC3I_16905 [Gemmataceae bacterium]
MLLFWELLRERFRFFLAMELGAFSGLSNYESALGPNLPSSMMSLWKDLLQRENMPLHLPTSYLPSSGASNTRNNKLTIASVDPHSGPSAAETPEPPSLTLFLVGLAGLAARGIQSRSLFRDPARRKMN